LTPPLKPAINDETKAAELAFDNNALALQLFGSHNSHLARIEQKLDLTIHTRGNEVNIAGDGATVDFATKVLDSLYRRLRKGLAVGPEEVDAALRMTVANSDDAGDDVEIQTRKRRITPQSRSQAVYVRAIDKCDLVFGLGPAGTGKTYLAMAKAVEKLVKGEVDRIILSRPAVEAGEQLGFLPGDMREKVDPYLRPLYDALFDMLPENQVAKRLESGEIEVAPLAFMRGRTLANAFVILDEAQNTSMIQMKMFLTRLGEHARMVVTGDLSQVDLPKGTRSGLRHAVKILVGIEGIDFVHFSAEDVVRHPLVSRIVRAYDVAEIRRRSGPDNGKKNHLVVPDSGNGEDA
jgi:phosphate starvation-inducible PhoH-like protein